MTTQALIWCGDRKIDGFMHAADVFGHYKSTISSFQPIMYDVTEVDELAHRMMPMRVKAWQEALKPKYVVAAIYVVDYPQYSWRNPTCWQVSDGHRECALTALLQAYGWADVPPPVAIGSYLYNHLNPDCSRQELDLLYAINDGDLDRLRQLSLPTNLGYFMVNLSLHQGYPDILDYLLSAGVFDPLELKANLSSFLHNVAFSYLGYVRTVDTALATILLSYGADISILTKDQLRRLDLPNCVLQSAARSQLCER